MNITGTRGNHTFYPLQSGGCYIGSNIIGNGIDGINLTGLYEQVPFIRCLL